MKKSFFLYFLIFTFISLRISSAQDTNEKNIYLPSPESNLPANSPHTRIIRPKTETQQYGDLNIDFNINNPYTNTNYLQDSSTVHLVCPHIFGNTLSLGANSQEVKLLQSILNLDERTQVSVSGYGSPGQETNYFGPATVKAVRAFQKLFSDKVSVVNGIVDGPTLDLINIICNTNLNEVKNSEQTTIPETSQAPTNTQIIDKNDNTLPQIRLSASISNFNPLETFKIYLSGSEALKTPSRECFISDGATIKEIRKLSPSDFLIIVTPNDNAKNIFIQTVADCVYDLNGNKNDVASNEIAMTNLVAVNPTANPSLVQNVQDYFSKILDSILSKNGTKLFTGVNGSPPTTNTIPAQANDTGGSSGGAGGSGGGFMDILKNLFGGGSGAGGASQNGQQSPVQQALNGITQGLGKSSLQQGQGAGGGQPSSSEDGISSSGASDNVACGGGNGSDSEIRSLLSQSGIGIGSVSTLEGLPKKTVVVLKKIKDDCGCEVVVTGGTSTTQHKTHGPGKAIIDLRSTDPKLRSYIKGDKLPAGVTYIDETETGIRTALRTGNHWHINANGWQCNN